MTKEIKFEPDESIWLKGIEKDSLYVLNLITKSESKNMSVSLLYLNGENSQVKNKKSDSLYMILDGIGLFTIWDGGYPKTTVVRQGDTVKIPSGTPYKDIGSELIMVCINHPSFDSEDIQILDRKQKIK